MLVRDEAQTVARSIDSVKPMIDYWIVIDTGSSDDTASIVCDTLREIPGELHHREWKGFADARTELLHLANGAPVDYALTLDADMTVEGFIPDQLDNDLYYITIHDSIVWRLPLLTRTGLPWSYQGVTHSYLSCDVALVWDDLDSLVVTHHSKGRPRKQKFERDIELLNGYLKDHPDDPRSVYYLAQSFKDIGDYQTAAELYGKRAKLQGWPEEQFHARYREGQMRYRLGQHERAVWCLLEAWAFRPSRAEPLRSLAKIYRDRNVNVAARMFDEMADRIPMADDRLFVEPAAYKENRIDWDAWRRDYDTMSFEDHKAFYQRVAQQHPVQLQWDGDAVREFLLERKPKHVVEIGGWDGSLAKQMLAEYNWIKSWTNYEIADIAAGCDDKRYNHQLIDTWPWEMDVRADALIASHVVEHMRAAQFEEILRRWQLGSVFIDTPIAASAQSWEGYHGSHIIEVGATELIGRLCALGYKPSLVRTEGRLLVYLDAVGRPARTAFAPTL